MTLSNYAQLEHLQTVYEGRGFNVLGFPCNQFGEQEPGTNEEIKKFARSEMNATFALFDKVDVNGADAAPLYDSMKAATGGGDVRWNFEKFLINRDGKVVRRYRSKVAPEDAALDIDALLSGNALDPPVAVIDVDNSALESE